MHWACPHTKIHRSEGLFLCRLYHKLEHVSMELNFKIFILIKIIQTILHKFVAKCKIEDCINIFRINILYSALCFVCGL